MLEEIKKGRVNCVQFSTRLITMTPSPIETSHLRIKAANIIAANIIADFRVACAHTKQICCIDRVELPQ